MKNSLVLVVAIIALAVIIVMGLRYELIVNSPIVAKMDRLTGEVWVANSGVWLKINDVAAGNPDKAVQGVSQAGAAAK